MSLDLQELIFKSLGR